MRGDRTLFSLLFANDRLTGPDPPDAHGQKAVLCRVFADAGWECPQILQAMDQVSDLYYDRVSQIKMDAWSKGRVMLIGDAAACVSLMAVPTLFHYFFVRQLRDDFELPNYDFPVP
jgi:hypothetical protein